MSESGLVLFGAGAAGKYALRFLRERGIEPIEFADNNVNRQGRMCDGVRIMSPKHVKNNNPDAVWVACAISRPAATQIRSELRSMGVKTKPLWECIPVHHGVPSDDIRKSLAWIAGDFKTTFLINDQCIFRRNPNYDDQISPDPISELYFPNFITHRDDEHFVDVGACQGDTIEAFLARWDKWSLITAFEPDKGNYDKLRALEVPGSEWIDRRWNAVGDARQMLPFQENGDWSSHLSTHASQSATTLVECVKLDDANLRIPPTYIKMDIEGFEPQALWGARELIKKHSPVLAVCAYHESSHLYEIPLLIHALNPDYKLYFRRYGEGAFEIVWYAVPPSRVVGSTSPMSYSDDHVG